MPATEESLGSIYIPRITLRKYSFFRRSARIICKTLPPQSHSQSSLPRLQTPLGTYYDLSYISTQQQSAEIVIPCPEINAVYCIARENWKIERHRRRIFEKDFPHYNKALRYRDIQDCNREDFGSASWEQIVASQKDYEPSFRQDKSSTPGFTTEESDLDSCSDTELFGYTVKQVFNSNLPL